MKRGLIAAAVLIAACVAQRVSAFPGPPAPLRIVVLGDSLALGTGAADPANSLTFRIYRALAAGRPGSEITNFAIGGTRASDVRRLEVDSLDSQATDLVLLIVGGNDVVRRTPAATFAREYSSLLTAIRTRAPRAMVVAFGVPDVARSPLFADSRAKTEALSRADDAAVRVAAAGSGATFVDLFLYTHHAATTQDFFSSDDFHPSDAGYARLAAFALPLVTRALANAARHVAHYVSSLTERVPGRVASPVSDFSDEKRDVERQRDRDPNDNRVRARLIAVRDPQDGPVRHDRITCGKNASVVKSPAT